jgi:GTP cyclohydrolase II
MGAYIVTASAIRPHSSGSVAQAQFVRAMEAAKKAMTALTRSVDIVDHGVARSLTITRRGVGPILNDYGSFSEFVFNIDDGWKEYHVLVKAKLTDGLDPMFLATEPILIRIDSGCQTGQMFGDQTCECKQQLDLAMANLQNASQGLIIHIPAQDGRGLGLPFKLSTLGLQAQLGLDTVEAATALAGGDGIDSRSYSGAIGILKFFGVSEKIGLKLMTNNPKKTAGFQENGYTVTGLVPVVIPPSKHTARHLLAKQKALGHLNLVPAGTAAGAE